MSDWLELPSSRERIAFQGRLDDWRQRLCERTHGMFPIEAAILGVR